jgi:hypothetical protein
MCRAAGGRIPNARQIMDAATMILANLASGRIGRDSASRLGDLLV